MHDFEIFAEKILYVKNILPNSLEIVELVEKTESSITENDVIPKWSPWKTSGESNYIFGKLKTSNLFKLETSSDDCKKIYNSIYNAIQESFLIYKNNVDQNIGSFSHFSIGKYLVGKMMGSHVDVDPNRESFEALFSGVIYLNNDYSGGELYFENQNVLIKPDPGSMVVFPSNPPFFHESKRVVSGQKYVCTVFSHQ
jgi:predicted 2-oxoglutarate/Fe(II)-dependent dioxygenase YbiX